MRISFNTDMSFLTVLRPSRLLMLAILSSAAGCGWFVERPTPGIVNPHAAVPTTFLFSWHEPYNQWMDTPVRVYYNKVPLDEIFQNSPFDTLEYRFLEKPEEMPLVSIDSLGISRRQLLWSIAHDYNLHMSLKTLPNGHPNEIIIRYRSDESTYRGRVDRSEIF